MRGNSLEMSIKKRVANFLPQRYQGLVDFVERQYAQRRSVGESKGSNATIQSKALRVEH